MSRSLQYQAEYAAAAPSRSLMDQTLFFQTPQMINRPVTIQTKPLIAVIRAAGLAEKPFRTPAQAIAVHRRKPFQPPMNNTNVSSRVARTGSLVMAEYIDAEWKWILVFRLFE